MWFSAIYILLFVSLHRLHRRRAPGSSSASSRAPARRPRRLTSPRRTTTWRTGAEPEQVREAALTLLKKRRFRAHAVGDAVAAEKATRARWATWPSTSALIVMLVRLRLGPAVQVRGQQADPGGRRLSNTSPSTTTSSPATSSTRTTTSPPSASP
ncbi:cytochrome c biogenesis protein ResB [Streptomyces thinghirensis]|nr:cytochrome c biogenesis protein ResB [Streptomyces thinghirensis]